jgi:hypothetical protein
MTELVGGHRVGVPCAAVCVCFPAFSKNWYWSPSVTANCHYCGSFFKLPPAIPRFSAGIRTTIAREGKLPYLYKVGVGECCCMWRRPAPTFDGAVHALCMHGAVHSHARGRARWTRFPQREATSRDGCLECIVGRPATCLPRAAPPLPPPLSPLAIRTRPSWCGA